MSSQTEADSQMTLAALNKILSAQRRGTISDRIYLRRLPTQIVVENVPDADLAWFTKNFPGEREQQAHGVKKGYGKTTWDTYRHVSLLREPLEGGPGRWHTPPPKVEVWGLLERHVCRAFHGKARRDEAGRRIVEWRCGAYGCNKKITKTAAREMGLLA